VKNLRTRLALLALGLLAALPAEALACAVCFSGRTDETRVAFGISTAGMTLLPLLLIGGTAWWLRRRAREIAAEEAARVAARAATPRRASAGLAR